MFTHTDTEPELAAVPPTAALPAPCWHCGAPDPSLCRDPRRCTRRARIMHVAQRDRNLGAAA